MLRTTCGSLVLVLVTCSLIQAAPPPLKPEQAQASDDGKTLWFDARDLTVEGQGWSDTKAPYDRLPGKAEGVVRDAVWGLSRHSAGICVRFATNAPGFQVRWKLTSSRLAMNHMAATGVSGVDLYVKLEGKWRWLASGRPSAQSNTASLATGISPERREYMLYLPLYNGVESVAIGIPAGSEISPGEPRPADRAKPIVFYGTSITQGGCASRTGMVHTAILGRWLDRPVINLGFSGNGRMELEVAELMAELDALVFVIDCLPNIDAAAVRERTEPLVKKLREKHPDTPIVLVEDRFYSDSYLIPSKRKRNESSQEALQQVYKRLQEAGDKQLYYISGAGMLGDDDEGTVDSSHPTDLGFFRQAQAFRQVLEPLCDR